MKKLYSFFIALAIMMPFTVSAQDYSTLEGMCATYSWETYDEFISNVSITKDKAVENGVVISNVFGKYELKGTFDTESGNVVIENQRVGFDAEKGQFLSFVHLAYEGDVDEEPLLLENEKDGDLFTYEEYGVVAESMDGEYLIEDGTIEYAFTAFLWRTGELQNGDWEDAGVAILFDGGFFTPLPRFGIGFKTPVEVVLEKSVETEGLYRLVHPWNSYFDKELDSYLEFNIADPKNVIIPTQYTGVVDAEYGAASVQNFVGMYVAGGFGVDDAMAAMNGKEDQYLCTYDDVTKVVNMPVGSTFTTFAGDLEGVWNVGEKYGATASYIVLPGGETSGVDMIVNDENAPVEYYNLQGIRVKNPAPGQLVIRRQGSDITKVIK